ncbi:MAG: hypothetical protein AAF517_12970 [Planctomycetota bacterium]
MRWNTLATALAIATLVSGCGGPPPVIDQPVNSARDLIESGDPNAAIATLRTVERLSEGTPAQQVDYHLTYGMALLQLGYVSEPAFLGDPNDPSTIKARERATELARSNYVDARREFGLALQLLPIKGDDGRTREDDAKDQYEAKLGTGLSYLREGILLDEPQWKSKADQLFGECDRLAPRAGLVADQDPRLIFARVRRFQTRELTEARVKELLKELDTFQELQKQSGYSVHVAYRDMLDYVRQFDTPKKVEAIANETSSEEARLLETVAEQYVEWLSEFDSGRSSLPPIWNRFEGELTKFFKNHRDWTTRRQSADRILADAREVTSQTDPDVVALRQMIGRLDQVDLEFREAEGEYTRLYRRALVDCVNALLLEASGNMELKNDDAYRKALDATDEAKRLASSDQLAEERSERLRAEFDDAANKIRGHQAFAKLEREVWGVLQREGVEKAVETLEQLAQNRDLLTNPTYVAEVASLRTAITEKSEGYREATQLIAQIDQIEAPSERLDLAKQLNDLVDRHQLEKLRVDATRTLRDAQIDNSDFADALATMQSIQNPTQTDQMAIGLCNYERKNYDEAARAFKGVKPGVVANSRYGVQALRAGGEALIQTKNHDASYDYFLKLKEVNQEAGRNDASVELRLIDCCKFELQKGLDSEEARLWRKRWLEHNPRDFENRKELMREAYALGKKAATEASSPTDADALRYFREAYDHLRFYLGNRGYDGLTNEDQKLADRLYAAFADYAPLDEATYVYVNEADGIERKEVHRPLGSDANRDQAEVRVTVAGTETPKQKWLKLSDKLIREIRSKNRPLLISIPSPEQTEYSTTWGNQRIEIADIGQEFLHGGERYQHCLIVRVYGSNNEPGKYFEYTLAPDVGIVREVNAASPTRDTYVLKSRS